MTCLWISNKIALRFTLIITLYVNVVIKLISVSSNNDLRKYEGSVATLSSNDSIPYAENEFGPNNS